MGTFDKIDMFYDVVDMVMVTAFCTRFSKATYKSKKLNLPIFKATLKHF